jgi:hypothetical protein
MISLQDWIGWWWKVFRLDLERWRKFFFDDRPKAFAEMGRILTGSLNLLNGRLVLVVVNWMELEWVLNGVGVSCEWEISQREICQPERITTTCRKFKKHITSSTQLKWSHNWITSITIGYSIKSSQALKYQDEIQTVANASSSPISNGKHPIWVTTERQLEQTTVQQPD